jgi:arsenical pump membrane protein
VTSKPANRPTHQSRSPGALGAGRPSPLRRLAPIIGFLAAVLVLAELCDREGLFEAAGRRMAAGARGRPVALLGLVFVVGSVVTATLSLDATVVLLTPVVFGTASRLLLRPKPHVYACTHLANSASLLLAALRVVVRAVSDGGLGRLVDLARWPPCCGAGCCTSVTPSRPPPSSSALGPSPCPILLVWPDQTPAVASIPPPPPRPPRP